MIKQSYDDAAIALWNLTEADWTVTVHHCITEPTCPFIDLVSDNPDLAKFEGFIGKTGDINTAIKETIEYAVKIFTDAQRLEKADTDVQR